MTIHYGETHAINNTTIQQILYKKMEDNAESRARMN